MSGKRDAFEPIAQLEQRADCGGRLAGLYPALRGSQALDAITVEVKRQRVEAVLWVDRLDVFRVESLDRQVCSFAFRLLW